MGSPLKSTSSLGLVANGVPNGAQLSSIMLFRISKLGFNCTFSKAFGSSGKVVVHPLPALWRLVFKSITKLPEKIGKDLCAAWATKIRTASKRATGANDSSKSTPSS
ncbi:hypothetical protein Tco_0339276 [Tanacetum coccineum]